MIRNPANTYSRHTETLDSWFDLIRSHQQCILWSPPLEIELVTTDCRAETLQLSHQPNIFPRGLEVCIRIITVTWKFTFYPRTGLYFRMCKDGADWHLIPRRISPRSEFFSRAHKNWHVMWGINLWPDWLPLARGSKFHTIHTPTKAAGLPPLE